MEKGRDGLLHMKTILKKYFVILFQIGLSEPPKTERVQSKVPGDSRKRAEVLEF